MHDSRPPEEWWHAVESRTVHESPEDHGWGGVVRPGGWSTKSRMRFCRSHSEQGGTLRDHRRERPQGVPHHPTPPASSTHHIKDLNLKDLNLKDLDLTTIITTPNVVNPPTPYVAYPPHSPTSRTPRRNMIETRFTKMS